MHDALTARMRLQATMPAATYGPSPAVLTQQVRPVDLLTSSGSSVTPPAAGKTDGTWAARRPFGGVKNS